jgi:hypothetical protein
MEKENKIYPAMGKTQNKIVETYAEDMAKVIENDKSGLIKKIIHEEEEHEIEKKNLSPESRKNKFFMLVGLLFIILGLITFFYFLMTKDVPTVSIEKQFTPLIFNDKSVFVEVKDLKKDEIAQTVFNEVNTTEVKNGGVEGIYLTEDKKMVYLRRFIALLKSNFVPGAEGSDNMLFVNDNFLMGVVNTETKDFFILLKTRSIADIFESLRAWESKMFFDLHGFFGLNISPETKYLLTKGFQDGIVENQNARILYDSNNKIVLMYVLANDNSVIITNTENAAREIMFRLSASQIKK